MKSKLMVGLMTALFVLSYAPGSFAQINLSFFPNTSSEEIANNVTAETADPTSQGAGLLVSGSILANSVLTTTTLIFTYPAEITSGVDDLGGPPEGDAIRIVGASGVFASVDEIEDINFEDGEIEVVLPGFDLAENALSGSFTLLGVRINAAGIGGEGPVDVNFALSSSGNNYLLSENSDTIITSLEPGVEIDNGVPDDDVMGEGNITIFTNKSIGDGIASFTVREPGDQLWRSAAQNAVDNPDAEESFNSTEIRLTWSLPEDIELNIDLSDATGDLVVDIVDGDTVEDGDETIIEVLNSDLEDNEAFLVTVTVVDPISPAVLELDAGTIEVSAAMVPIGDPLDSDDEPTDADGYPRFEEVETDAITIGQVVAANTTILIPFALRQGTFDTGITVANTTADPFGAAGGGATPGGGTLRFDLFPRTSTGAGTAFGFTTSSSVRPGIGLSSTGTLVAGGTWSGLLSEVLTAAGQTGAFVGYIFIRADFQLAHSTAFISDFATFTSASSALVLPNPASVDRDGEVGLDN
jgi:hypothetical protein